MRDWVARVFQPELERQGCLVVDYDALGFNQFAVEEVLVKTKYIVVLLTASYLMNRLDEFKTTMAVLQAIDTKTPRFIPILRETFTLPLWIRTFVGLDMTPQKTMNFSYDMERLVKRLKKQPHQQ